jgi:hypothetical protein
MMHGQLLIGLAASLSNIAVHAIIMTPMSSSVYRMLRRARDHVDGNCGGVRCHRVFLFDRDDALKQRALAPHIYESAEEATTHLRDLKKKKTG